MASSAKGVSPGAAAALSGHLDTRTAAMEVADQVYEGLNGECSLLLVFASFHHRAAFGEAIAHLRRTVRPQRLIGVTAESVLGGEVEREGRAGLAALALHLPDVSIHPWSLTPQQPLPSSDAAAVRAHTGIDDQSRAIVLLADPFTTPMPQLLEALHQCRRPTVPVTGGLASGASQPGQNVIALDDQIITAGAVGITLGGAIDPGFIVSQGCRPIGRPLVVTKLKDQTILELAGQVPMAVLKEMAGELDAKERALLNRGLLVGVVIDEYRDHFGRGDFLIRNVTALDMKRGVISVAEQLRVGQTIQFHVRDAETAGEDLHLLLDAQQLEAPPFAAAIFTCNGRGARLFGEPNHDLNAVRSRLGELPAAGFFAAGEIGPVGDRSFVHGHTVSALVFRGSRQ